MLFAKMKNQSKEATVKMKNLRRALFMAFRYKWSIVTSTISAFLIAILWGVNIGGALPIIEIVFGGNSLHDVIDERIESSERAMLKSEEQIKELETQQSVATPGEF